MATQRREIELNCPAERVWDALSDFHAVDRRVAPGFVVKSVPDGNARVITFANGSSAREDLVTLDDTAMRLVYAIATERLRHYNAAVQIVAVGREHCRFIWTVDFMPDALSDYIGQQMNDAVKAIKPTLESQM